MIKPPLIFRSGVADQPDSARLHEYIERPLKESTTARRISFVFLRLPNFNDQAQKPAFCAKFLQINSAVSSYLSCHRTRRIHTPASELLN